MTDNLDRLKTALAERYAIERELGAGGMATVYLARDLKHERQVAVKVLRPELAAALGPDRFLREIKITAGLNHPHILMLLDSGEADGFLYYVMPYVEGESLRDRLNREKQLDVDDALKITEEVADALNFAHSHDVVHRDIKPENILLSGGHAVVADFGIARAVTAAGGERLTETGLAVGTPHYMSPEQASAGAEIDGRSDVYSLGCVLYEMLAGEPPYTGPTPQAVIAKRLSEPVPRVSTLRETVPETVEWAITKALAKAPADRFATASQFADALEGARARSEPIPLARPSMRRRRLLLATAAAAIVVAGVGWAITRLGPASPRIDSLAVLPLANLSGDPEQEYFVDGMHDAIIAELARLGALKVISRTSVMRYRNNTTLSMPAIARELGVDALLEGSVLRADGQVRITLQLIEGSSDRHLWTDSYVRDIGNVLALQAEIAGAAAREIALSLSPAARQRLELATAGGPAPTPDPDPEAYDAYLRGRYYMGQAPAQLEPAIRFFEQAIAKDPTFAPAHAALAEAYWWSGFFAPEFQERAGVTARKAVDLNPTLPEAQVALALVRMNDWDWQGSEAAFERALQLNPNSSVAHQWYAQLLRQTVRLDQAMSEAQRALELDPFSLTVRTMVGWVLYNQHRYDEAVEMWDGVLELEPDFGLAIYNQGLAYWGKGMGEEVIASAQRATAARLPVDEVIGDWLLAGGYALSGQRDRAKELLGRLKARYGLPPTLISLVHLALGADDEALHYLERAFAMRDPWLPNMTSEPLADRLRDHPRFQALRAKMGLP